MTIKATDMVKITPVDVDGEGKGVEVYVLVSEITAGAVAAVPEATTTVEGTVMQAALQPDAAGANPTKAEYDALLAALVAAGIMASA